MLSQLPTGRLCRDGMLQLQTFSIISCMVLKLIMISDLVHIRKRRKILNLEADEDEETDEDAENSDGSS